MNKYRVLLLAVGLCLVLTKTGAQNTDSLRQAIDQMPADTNRVMALRVLFRDCYAADQNGDLLPIADEGLALSRRLHFDKGIDLFLFYKATALDVNGRGKEAIPVFEEGLAFARERNNREGVAGYQTNLGAAYYALGDFDKALAHYFEAYTIYLDLHSDQDLSKVLNNIGIIYRTQGKFDRAVDIYKQSLTIKERLADSLGMADSYLNIAAALGYSRRENEALDYLARALAIYETQKHDNDAAACYTLLGELKYKLGDLPAAKQALLKAQTRFAGEPNVENGANLYYLLGSVAVSEKNYPLSINYLKKAAEMARKFGQQDRLLDILKQRAEAESLCGNSAAAYAALSEASGIRDTVEQHNRTAALAEMQTKFDVAQKDNQIRLNQIELQQRTRQRNALLGSALLLILLSAAVFWGLRQRLRANKKLAEQETLLRNQQMEQLRQNARLNTLHAMVEGQEQERNRIARDLHDSLGGTLAALKAHVSELQHPTQENGLYAKIVRMIDDAAMETRRIAHNLMPGALELTGLEGALEDLVAEITRMGLDSRLECIPEHLPELPAEIARNAYRIVQELSANTLKHAGAKHFWIQLLSDSDRLILICEDDGSGFDKKEAELKKGLGLSSIEYRVQFLGGTIDWDILPGEGTTVTVNLPLHLSEKNL